MDHVRKKNEEGGASKQSRTAPYLKKMEWIIVPGASRAQMYMAPTYRLSVTSTEEKMLFSADAHLQF
jgi:hypothetical protein